MDQKDKTYIATVLLRAGTANKRLVLGLASPSGIVVEVDQARFKNRTEYRKALVERQRRAQQKDVDKVVAKLVNQGLDVRTFPLVNTIVVQGSASLLAEALNDDRVATAVLDEELPLIKPVK